MGLIIRKKNPEDGRGVLIYLTPLVERETYLKYSLEI
jgi:DNA-binding MarR family transcriptional regulator